MTDLPVDVYGVNLVVRLVPERDVAVQLRCPKGAVIRYGEVVSRGDGFDADGKVFRAMPYAQAIVVFEEDGAEPTGHAFMHAGREYRLIAVDDVLVAFPPRWSPAETRRPSRGQGVEPSA